MREIAAKEGATDEQVKEAQKLTESVLKNKVDENDKESGELLPAKLESICSARNVFFSKFIENPVLQIVDDCEQSELVEEDLE